MTLLEKAKAINKKPTPEKVNHGKFDPDELIDVSIAWLTGEVSSMSVSSAMGFYNTNYLYWVSRGLKLAYERGMIKTAKKSDSFEPLVKIASVLVQNEYAIREIAKTLESMPKKDKRLCLKYS